MGCGVSRVDCIVEPSRESTPRKDSVPTKNGVLPHETKVAQNNETVSNGKHTNGYKNGVIVSNGDKRKDVISTNEGYQPDISNEQSDETNNNVDNSTSFDIKKTRIYTTVEIFADVDKVALNVPPSVACSIDKLMEHLLENIKNTDLFKIRVIWRWITHNISYDVDSYFKPDKSFNNSVDSADILLSGKSICSGYSNLFLMMGELAGLQVKCIPGWSKGYSFEVGKSFNGTQTNHLWNVAMLEDSWWLFDCTWGAGYIDDNQNFVAEYDEHFFMTNPKQFIYDHFPDKPSWQLLELPVSLEDYENMTLFTKCFFNLNLKAVTHDSYLIPCTDGKVHLKFKINKSNPIKCVGTLSSQENVHVGDNYLHIYTTEKVLHTFVTAPAAGKFTLKLFADNAESVVDEHATLPLICTYLIDFSVKTDSSHTYPKQFKKWCHGFMLHSPMEGDLCIGETYTFKVSVTDVCKMAVCLGGKKSSVSYMDNTNGKIWEKPVTIERGTERISVVAKFMNTHNTTFSSILEYTVNNNMCILKER